MGAFRGVELVGLTFSTPRLDIRPWTESDAGAVHSALNDPKMGLYLNIPAPYTRADAVSFVGERASGPAERATGLELAVVDVVSAQVVGSAALRLPSTVHGHADIGYWIAPSAQGHGYAAEIADHLARWALEREVHRVELECEVVNLASVRSALRAGFRFESIRRNSSVVRGQVADTAAFVRLAEDDGAPIKPVFAPLPPGGLSDGVITLRATAPEDEQALAEEGTDALTVEVGFTGDVPIAAQLARTASRAGLEWLVGPKAQLSIVDVETGSYAGSMQLRLSGPPNVAGIGYGVHPSFRGRGYTARALRLLSPWAFEVGGFARLELGAKGRNVASQRAALSGGFEPDGVRTARLREPDGSFSAEVRFVRISPLIDSHD